MKDQQGFQLRTVSGLVIRFRYYLDEAPVTSEVFHTHLPYAQTFVHARTSGEEFWTDKAPPLHILQENASVFCLPGEAGISPVTPARVKTAGMMGIYYGNGKGLDATNIFAKVFDEDMEKLKELGDQIWRYGEQILTFEKL